MAMWIRIQPNTPHADPDPGSFMKTNLAQSNKLPVLRFLCFALHK